MSEEEKRKLHHTTISTSSYTTDRLWVLRKRLGLRPEKDQRRRHARGYNNDEIINMALDVFERELDQKDSPVSK